MYFIISTLGLKLVWFIKAQVPHTPPSHTTLLTNSNCLNINIQNSFALDIKSASSQPDDDKDALL